MDTINIILGVIVREKKAFFAFFKWFFDVHYNKEILFLQYSDDRIMLPGGHMKNQEFSEDAAKREISEELGLKKGTRINLAKNVYNFINDKKHIYHGAVVHFNPGEKIHISPQIEENIVKVFWEDPLKIMFSDSRHYKKIRKKLTPPAIKIIRIFLLESLIDTHV